MKVVQFIFSGFELILVKSMARHEVVAGQSLEAELLHDQKMCQEAGAFRGRAGIVMDSRLIAVEFLAEPKAVKDRFSGVGAFDSRQDHGAVVVSQFDKPTVEPYQSFRVERSALALAFPLPAVQLNQLLEHRQCLGDGPGEVDGDPFFLGLTQKASGV